MLIRIERDEIVDVYTEVGGPCGRQPPLFYGLVGSIGVIGDDVIRLLVLIERGSWKNLRKNRKIFSRFSWRFGKFAVPSLLEKLN